MSVFKTRKSLKMVSLFLVCSLLITQILIGQHSAAAEGSPEFTYMSSETARASNYVSATVNRWQKNGALTLSNVDDTNAAGLNYAYKNKCKEATHFEGIRDDINLNQLTLKFSGFDATNSKNATFVVRLSDNTSSGVYSKGSKGSDGNYTYLALVLDADKGILTSKYAKKSVLIINDQSLKLENLRNKEFTYYFEINDDDGVDVTVTVGDTVLFGEIGQEAFSYLKNTSKTYTNHEKTSVLIGPGKDGVEFNLSFVGYQNGVEIKDEFLSGLKKLDVKNTRIASEGTTINEWKNNFLREDLNNGGIRLSYNNALVEHRDGIKPNVSLDGLFLQFSRFVTNDTKNKLMIQISDGFDENGYDIWCKGDIESDGIFSFLGIVLDTKEGTLTAKTNELSEEIISDESLKYASISKERFSFHFIKNKDDSFKIYMVVGGKSIEGTISNALISDATAFTDYKNCGVMVSAAENNTSFTTNFIGYKTGVRKVDVTSVITAINNIGTVFLEDLSDIRETRAMYNELSDDNKIKVVNYDKLVEAENKANELAEIADKSLTVIDKKDLRLSGHSNPTVTNVINSWNDMKITDVATGGVRFTFENARPDVRDGLSDIVNLNGLSVLFDNFYSEENAQSLFSVYFGNGDNDWGCTINESLAITLNPDNGTLIAYPSGEIIINSDLLKFESIKYQRMMYEFMADDNGGFDLSVKIKGQILTGKISASSIASASNYLKDHTSCMMAIACYQPSSYSVNLIGYRTVDSLYVGNVKTTTEQINSIGKVSLDDAFAMRKARYMYESLTEDDKLLVDNYQKLVEAEKEFYNLSVIADLRLDYHTSPTYLLYDEGLFYGVWKDMFTLKELSTGGTRYVFKNANRNVRQGIEAKDGLDGMLLQFDNLAAGFATSCSMTLFIGSEKDNGWGPSWPDNKGTTGYPSDYPLALTLDAVNGRILAKVVDNGRINDLVIIENDSLKFENICLQRFSYYFEKTGEFDYQLTVNVKGKSIKGELSADVIKKTAVADCINSECFINLSNWENSSYSIDFIGYYNTAFDATINAVIEAIDNLPKVISDEDIDDVKDIEAMYLELLYKHRRVISNYPLLAKALNEVHALEQDDISWIEDMPKGKDGKPLYGEESIS